MQSFIEKWHTATQHGSLAIGIAPKVEYIAYEIMRHDAPFFPFSKAVIEATKDFAGAYVFDMATFLAQGAAGAIALERSISLVPEPAIKILHIPVATPDYFKAVFTEGLFVDAITLATTAPIVIDTYTAKETYGAFVPEPVATNKPNLGHYTMEQFTLNNQSLRWVIEPVIYASGKSDFKNAMYSAAQSFANQGL